MLYFMQLTHKRFLIQVFGKVDSKALLTLGSRLTRGNVTRESINQSSGFGIDIKMYTVLQT